MYQIAIAALPLFMAGETLAHPGHGALALHTHGWEYALLGAVVAGVAWFIRAKK
jgi:hypothetical protein